MENQIMIASIERVQAATITSGSTIADAMPLSELTRRHLGDAMRFTDLSDAHLVVDLGAAYEITLIAALAHSASAGASWRIRAAASEAALTAAPAYDSETLGSPSLLMRPAKLTGDNAWPWHHAIHVPASGQSYRYWRLDFYDAANPATVLDLGGLVIADAYRSPQGADFGYRVIYPSGSIFRRSIAGSEFPTRRGTWRVFELSLSNLSKAQWYDGLFALFRRLGNADPFLLVLDPDNPAFQMEEAIYAHFVEMAQTNRFLNLYAARWRAAELLPDEGIASDA